MIIIKKSSLIYNSEDKKVETKKTAEHFRGRVIECFIFGKETVLKIEKDKLTFNANESDIIEAIKETKTYKDIQLQAEKTKDEETALNDVTEEEEV